MSYIGLRPVTQSLSTSTELFSGDGSTLQFTLAQGVGKASDLIVMVGSTLQRPGVNYTAASTTLVFTAGNAPTAGTNNITVSYLAGSLNTVYLSANAFPAGSTTSPSIYVTTAASTGIYWPSTSSIALTAAGNTRVTISDAAQGVASGTTSGALRVSGGAGVTGAGYFGGTLYATGTTVATNSSTGALIVSGGVGIAGAVYVGGTMSVSGGLTVSGAFNTTATNSLTVNTPFLFLANTNVGNSVDIGFVGQYNDGTQRYTGLFRAQTDGAYKLFTNLTNQPTTLVDVANVSYQYADLWIGSGNITSTTNSTSSTTGGLLTMGGIGSRGSIYVNSLNSAVAIGNGGTSGTGSIGASGAIFGAFWGTTANFNNTVTLNSSNQTVAITNGGTSGTGTIGASGAVFNNVFAQTFTGNLTSIGKATIGATTNTGVAASSAAYISGDITVASGASTGKIWFGSGGTGNIDFNTSTYTLGSGSLIPSANVTYNLGSTTAWWSTVYASTFSGISTTAKYADLAENYLADSAYQPGTVLDFGGEAEVTQSSSDMSTKVAGVVSTNPAHLMNTGLEGETVVALALSGRVPCQVQGTVAKGDLMVSAGNGSARAEANPKVGSIIGKALENFSGDNGIIEVVIGKN